jgi:hypothetical protein
MVVLTWSNEGLSQQVWDSLRVEQSGAGAGAVDCLGSRCRCGGAVRAQNAVGLSPFTERRGALGGGRECQGSAPPSRVIVVMRGAWGRWAQSGQRLLRG